MCRQGGKKETAVILASVFHKHVYENEALLLTASMAVLRGTKREEEAAGAKGLSPSGTHSIWYPVLLALKL